MRRFSGRNTYASELVPVEHIRWNISAGTYPLANNIMFRRNYIFAADQIGYDSDPIILEQKYSRAAQRAPTNTTWNNFFHEQAVLWEQTVLAWIICNHNHPVLIVKYEDIKKNTQTELRRMLNFLQVCMPYSSSRLKDVVARGYRMYRRE